jgi:hypothetical protein
VTSHPLPSRKQERIRRNNEALKALKVLDSVRALETAGGQAKTNNAMRRPGADKKKKAAPKQPVPARKSRRLRGGGCDNKLSNPSSCPIALARRLVWFQHLSL